MLLASWVPGPRLSGLFGCESLPELIAFSRKLLRSAFHIANNECHRPGVAVPRPPNALESNGGMIDSSFRGTNSYFLAKEKIVCIF